MKHRRRLTEAGQTCLNTLTWLHFISQLEIRTPAPITWLPRILLDPFCYIQHYINTARHSSKLPYDITEELNRNYVDTHLKIQLPLQLCFLRYMQTHPNHILCQYWKYFNINTTRSLHQLRSSTVIFIT